MEEFAKNLDGEAEKQYSVGRSVHWHGTGEKPEVVLQAEKDAIPTEKLKTKGIMELREKLAFINFDTLRSVFAKRYESLGLNSAQMNFFTLETISDNGGPLSAGQYQAQENKLGLNINAIERHSNEESFNPEIAKAHVLFHEETHALGRVECHFEEARSRPLKKVGYSFELDKPHEEWQKNMSMGPAAVKLFESFNEGITEMIAHEVLREYAKETKQFSDEDIESYITKRQQHEYCVETQAFIDSLAKRSVLSREELVELIIAGYFKGENFLQEIFNEYPQMLNDGGTISTLSGLN